MPAKALPQSNDTDIIFGNKTYRLLRKLGGGAFGEIYKCLNVYTQQVCAVKIEAKKTRMPQLHYEARLFNYLNREDVVVGFPKVHWYGSEGEFNLMVMELLGPSLELLHEYCNRRFSLKTTIMVADQCISRLEFLHAKCYIHRDVKPDNFVMGTGKFGHHVYMIDLGLAKRYKNPLTDEHIPMKEGKLFTGTSRYASLYCHLGMEQSCRDDLESLAYMLVYLAKGSLPWMGLQCVDKRVKYQRVNEMKMSTSPETICRGLPAEFLELLRYARELDFASTPNYGMCRRLFHAYMQEEGYYHDFRFDWLERAAQSQGSTVGDNASALSSRGAWSNQGSDRESIPGE